MTKIEVSGRRANGPGRAHHLRRGDEMAKRTESERFWAKVDRSGGPDACWPWLGFVRPNGYGLTTVGRSSMQANRYAWISSHGPIAEGLVIDHLCHNADGSCLRGDECPHRRCCNPAHLEPVTRWENNIRALRPGTRLGSPRPGNRCKRGHLVVGDNAYARSDGLFDCQACMRFYRKRWREKRAAESVPWGQHPPTIED